MRLSNLIRNQMNSSSNKSGLALISCYSDDDDDEEEENVTEAAETSPQRNMDSAMPSKDSRLPLPSSIVQLYKDKPGMHHAPEDDPSQHDGRIRSFPHQRGNWSTYVYIPYKKEEGYDNMLVELQTMASIGGGPTLKPVDDPHISVTRTVVLLHHWIDPFITSVKRKLSICPSFTVELRTLKVYCNEERTRTFLGLSALGGARYLGQIAQALDGCLAEFRLPPFYEDPSFHLSLLWAVGDVQEALEARLATLQGQLHMYTSLHPHLLYMQVSECLCKTGNKMFTFPLRH